MDALKLFVWEEPFENSSGVYVLAHTLEEAYALLEAQGTHGIRSDLPPQDVVVYDAPVAIVEYGVCLKEYTYDG